ncbi:NACHT domain-containing protein [Chitinophaga tropicalis]|uniref:NACHT domain-containing protein n=1 Tax=Chitinophaga tropicalis TaxID=2683588 RepID=A0A7K1U6T4_9BACT|nr:hypothetical protein [Chitinophaga tropicalis]MVT09685.1 hypothetical protein [Chitinophaga tropicalis]
MDDSLNAFLKDFLKKIDDSYPILGEYIITKVSDFVLSQISSFPKSKNAGGETHEEQFIYEFKNLDALKHSIIGMLTWADNENIIRSFNPRFNSEYYVYQTFRKYEIYNKQEFINLDDILTSRSNYIFKAGPGTGKSTLIKHLINNSPSKDNHINKNGYFPYLLKCRDISSNVYIPRKKAMRQSSHADEIAVVEDFFLITEKKTATKAHILISILGDLGFYVKYPNIFMNDDTYGSWVKSVELFLWELSNKHSIIYLVDGYDEIQEPLIKEALVEILNNMALKCPASNFIITSREISTIGNFANTYTYEINFFKDEQLNLFIDKWFVNKPQYGDLLKEKLRTKTYYDTLYRPLILAFICVLFEKNNAEIPHTSVEIYFQIIELLVEKWEAENRLRRHSKYLKFVKEKKIRFLAEFAFALTKNKGEQEFTRENLRLYLRSLLSKYKIPIDELEYLVEEIENHTGLFIETGVRKYCFSHFSLQEFLTAYHIFNIGSVYKDENSLVTIPEIFALCVALSSNPNNYFAELYHDFLTKHTGSHMQYILVFLERLMNEIPDFEVEEILGICFLGLYSGLILKKDGFNRIIDDSFTHKIRETYTDTVDPVFERIINNEVIRNSVKKSLLNYSKSFELNSYHSIYEVKSFLQHGNIFRLPNYLIVNENLFKITANNTLLAI